MLAMGTWVEFVNISSPVLGGAWKQKWKVACDFGGMLLSVAPIQRDKLNLASRKSMIIIIIPSGTFQYDCWLFLCMKYLFAWSSACIRKVEDFRWGEKALQVLIRAEHLA